jgi:diguanylate cyclase (GGDEF)-like protein/PAS domain S-box-containing protein
MHAVIALALAGHAAPPVFVGVWIAAGLIALAGTLAAARRVPPSRVRVAWGLWTCAAACWLAGAVAFAASSGDGSSGRVGSFVGVADVLWWLFALFALAGLALRSPPGRFAFHLFTLDALPVVLLAIVLARFGNGQSIHASLGSQLFSSLYVGLYLLLALVSVQLMALEGARRVPANMWILGPGFCLAAAGALAWSITRSSAEVTQGWWAALLWSIGLVLVGAAGFRRGFAPDSYTRLLRPERDRGARALPPAAAVVGLLVLQLVVHGSERSFLLALTLAAALLVGARFYLVRSELMHSRAALASREEHLRLALHTAGMGSWEWNTDTGEVRWSGELENIHGLAAGGFGGTFEAFLELVHPDDRELVEEAVLRAAREDADYALDYRIVRPDGEVRWRRGVGRIFRGAGKGARMIGVGQDITEVRNAEQQLREAELRFRTLVEQLPLVSYLERLDEESAMYISPQIEALLGYTAEEWVSDPTFFGKVLHPEDRKRVLDGFAAMHATGEPVECEYRLIANDGRVVWIRNAAVVVCDGGGQPLYAQGYLIDITEKKRAEEALLKSQQQLREQIKAAEHQALHDSLTDLPNRLLFRDRIEQALRELRRSGTGLAVMLLDLDRFKEVNDTLGHHFGDLMLEEIGRRLPRALREGDTVARLGGDEFGVLALDIRDSESAAAVAEKIRRALAEPVVLAGVAVEVDVSIGIALSPGHGDDVETLLRQADVSMYVSKTTHSPSVYATDHDHYSPARLALVGELRRALEKDDEIVVYYQPQADTSTGEVTRVEALVRWRHPEHGLLAPDQFIPLAEHTGLMKPLTNYVLNTALGECSRWRREGYDVAVAVNVTGRNLLDLHFPEDVSKLLTKWRIAPAQLELEITEGTILTDPLRARSVLTRLNKLGVTLAIDDFGSGQSSLGHLKRLPIDTLKIDKSFVLGMTEDEGDAAIVRSMIDLGHNLGLSVVAEGVETPEAARHLADIGCDVAQGNYLGRPQPAERVDQTGWRALRQSKAM